jgi:hypothetical protein
MYMFQVNLTFIDKFMKNKDAFFAGMFMQILELYPTSTLLKPR